MKILITGANGFIGKSIALKLIENNYKVTANIRNNNNAAFWNKLNVQILDKDILKMLKKDLHNFDVIIHAAGKLGSFHVSKESLYKDNFKITKHLVSLCTKQKIIHISSAGILGPIINGDETHKYKPTNDYEKSKADAEKIISKYDNHIILRPEFVYGENDSHLVRFFETIKKGRFRIIGLQNTILHPTYIEDVTNATLAIIQVNIKKETYTIAGDKPVSVKYLYHTICSELKCKPNVLRIPSIVALQFSLASEIISKILNIKPLLTSSQVRFLTQSRSFNTDKIKDATNYSPIKFEIGIKKTIEGYKNRGLL